MKTRWTLQIPDPEPSLDSERTSKLNSTGVQHFGYKYQKILKLCIWIAVQVRKTANLGKCLKAVRKLGLIYSVQRIKYPNQCVVEHVNKKTTGKL